MGLPTGNIYFELNQQIETSSSVKSGMETTLRNTFDFMVIAL